MSALGFHLLQETGIGTDPKLDPKGAFTVEMMTKAANLYHEPDLVEKILGAPENPAPGPA
jgi:molybdate/tungstate transport system substrate-binding protein